MTGKVIQGSFLTGQPRWSPSVQPKIAPSSFHPKTVAPPPTVFAPRPPQPPASAFATQAQPVQRHATGGAFAVEAGMLGIASGGGKPLADAVRSKMEASLGADFSGVRVHVGPQAERIGAIAFTTGNDIYFAPGRYQPETIQGQQLLGHELAHVVQQRQGRVRNPLGSGLAVVQDRALEAEADRLGQRAATHRVAPRRPLQPKLMQRGGSLVQRALARGSRSIQLAPMAQVMGATDQFKVTRHELKLHYALFNDMQGWGGIPAGYHVTIFPNLSEQQALRVQTDATLTQAENAVGQPLVFTRFNVTKGNHGTHFYFSDTGQVEWVKTKTEAGLNDADWEEAIDAALCVYAKIGVATSKDNLFGQLHERGRTARNTAHEKPLKPQSTRTPGVSKGMVPRAFRNGPAIAPPSRTGRDAPYPETKERGKTQENN